MPRFLSLFETLFYKNIDYKLVALDLIHKNPKLIRIVVGFEFSNKEPKSKFPKRMVKAIHNWGNKYTSYVRDVLVTYSDTVCLYRHPRFKFSEMSISETEETYFKRLRDYVERNRSPAQLEFLKERSKYLKEKYPFY